MRKPLTNRQRLDLFCRARGRCQRCGWRLRPGMRWEIDHVIPLSLGGADAVANLQVLCASCHGHKTARQDQPALSKAKRLQIRHWGAHRARAIMAGSRRSPWKKGLDGRVERRPRAKREAPREGEPSSPKPAPDPKATKFPQRGEGRHDEPDTGRQRKPNETARPTPEGAHPPDSLALKPWRSREEMLVAAGAIKCQNEPVIVTMPGHPSMLRRSR